MSWIILTLNPGSTSTKIALFSNHICLNEKTVYHTTQELSDYSISSQIDIRLSYIRIFLHECEQNCHMEITDIDLIMGRGGLIGPVNSGVYRINDAMKDILISETYGSHASNFGALLADILGKELAKPACIADPPSVDELEDIARFSGHGDIQRRSLFHALNHKAAAREAARLLGHSYEKLQLIVCHMGGGISVGAHKFGRVIDVNNALEEGPMSPERAGTLPSLSLLNQFAASGISLSEFKRTINGKGGLFSYTGSSDVRAIEAGMFAEKAYSQAIEAMIYQISKEIGAMAVVLSGEVDAIVLTGGLANSDLICDAIKNRVSFVAQIIRIPGEREMQALAHAGLRLLQAKTEALEYERV